ncbi:metal-sulfur cluster assembly factor [Halobaculum sp. CBA1158]|uniref:1,2-phenylacetyl-CoA epoxidase subunit PaaD n=1 Tax=Halobaculum sp. CBA1158 TaxID=2904243 RepID=UPI001F3D418A|nr:1,2-phenylacetyl-CoA epoxidase subunit PaaD [Halobaculum sp. CBA1158]UIP00586.1 metal-sulfur cluster assembly factor [Halobaculum sp. CBA1158]
MPTNMPTDVPGGAGGDAADDTGAPSDAEACAYTSYEDGEAPDEYPKTGADASGVETDVWDALYEVEDPEMPVGVVDLGLIYGVTVDEGTGRCEVEMTLTYTGCPARDMLTNDVRCAAETAPGVEEAEVRLRYTPEWTVAMVTDAGREALREFGLSV